MARAEVAKVVEKYLGIKDVADMLSVSESHVYMLVRTGNIRAIDITCSGNGGPNSMRISLRSLLDFQKSREIQPEKKYSDELSN